MAAASSVVSILIVLAVSILLVLSGLRKQPGIGVIGSVFLIGLTLWLRNDSLPSLGFGAPPSWAGTLLLGLALGVLIQLMTIAVFEPLSERMTGVPHDHSIVESVKGNWKAFVQWMLVVWVFVALLEEGIYRGFLMTELAKVLGATPAMLALNILVTSIVFGLSHSYQGRSGALSTGAVGALLAIIFVMSNFNLWLAVLTHGFIDTVGIALIAVEGDKAIRQRLWGSERRPLDG